MHTHLPRLLSNGEDAKGALTMLKVRIIAHIQREYLVSLPKDEWESSYRNDVIIYTRKRDGSQILHYYATETNPRAYVSIHISS